MNVEDSDYLRLLQLALWYLGKSQISGWYM